MATKPTQPSTQQTPDITSLHGGSELANAQIIKNDMATKPLHPASIEGGVQDEIDCRDLPNSKAFGGMSMMVETVACSSETTSSTHDGTSADGLHAIHEGPSAIIHRIRLNDGRDIAAKSLECNPEPAVDDTCRLNNEYIILSGPLAKCASGVRKVIGRASKDGDCDEVELGSNSKLLLKRYGRHTLYLEWADGVSLAEWMNHFCLKSKEFARDERNNEQAIIREIVQIMHCIASALALVHESGVLHNDVSVESFIVQNGEPRVKIIGFGHATPLSMQEIDDEGENVNDDLFCLGVIFRDLLKTGFGANNTRNRRKNSLERTSITSLAEEELAFDSIPPFLLALVYNLTKACDVPDDSSRTASYLPDPRYTTATEVAEVLKRMLDNPRAFLYPQSEEDIQSINFQSNVLYGRSKQIEMLQNAYQGLSCPDQDGDARPHMVVITGSAGAGKSALVKRLGMFVAQSDKGFFSYGKYDQRRGNEPYSALAAALESLCESILLKGGSVVKQVKKHVLKAVGAEVGVLTRLVPGLSRILAGDETAPVVTEVASLNGVEAMNRFKFVFRMFARAVASPGRTIVLALDDLQWADEASLHLIRSIMTDQSNLSPLLIVVSYRHDEVSEGHPLKSTISDLDGKTEIDVGNLNFDELNTMVSDALGVPRLVTCNKLTSVTLQKTLGNAFFAKQFLRSIADNGLLVFETKPCRWECNFEGISSMSVTDNVLDLLTSKICDRLSRPVQEVLELAACLGSEFEMPALHLLAKVLCSEVAPTGNSMEKTRAIANHQNCHELDWMMHTLLKEGLVEMVKIGVRYKFAHDRIQQAAYSIIPEDRRATLHLRIGELLWKHLQEDDPEWKCVAGTHESLFVAIDQMNKGSTEIAGKAAKKALVELNLRAGQICIKKPAFQQASSYLKLGIALLDLDSCFEDHYSLSLELHNAAIEAEYCNGRFDESSMMVERVLTNANTFDDKLHAYKILLRSLGTQHKFKEAIETGVDVLEMLGERFPKKEPIPKSAVLLELTKTKMALKGRSDDELLSLSPMVHRKKCAAMQILASLMMYAYLRREDLVPLFVFRMVRISTRYGICKATAFAFSSFGMILAGALGDVRRGYRFGRLALAFLESGTDKDYVAKVNLTVHYIINHWTVPLTESIQPLLHSSRIGMEAGENDYAMACALTSLANGFYSGESLHDLEEKSRKLFQQMVEYNTEAFTARVLPLWQMILNFLGRSPDPLVLTGEAMDQDEYLAEALQTNSKHVMTLVHLYCSYLAYFFGKYELAAKLSEIVSIVKDTILGSFHVCEQTFIEGLSATALAHSTKRSKWKRVARRAFKKLKKWSTHSPNLLQKRFLLEAELAALNGKTRKAMHIYEAAISAAARIGCTRDEALSYEKAGLFLSESGEACKASQFFVRAHQLYLKWGALALADHLYSQQMTSVN